MKYQDIQHFSHHHILQALVLDENEELECQACEKLIIEPFHGCISCNFYLHEDCLNAPRSLVHPSHPSHPLTLLPTPTYSSRSFTCNACGSLGKSCSLSCAHCEFDLHVHCALLPQTVLLAQHHHHELKLIFDSPFDHEDENTIFVCDLCHGKTEQNSWLYYCADCDFGTHVECSISKYVNKPNANATMMTKTKEEPVIRRPTKSPVRKTEKKSVKNTEIVKPKEVQIKKSINEKDIISTPTKSPIRKTEKKSAKKPGENPKSKPVSEAEENSGEKLPEEEEEELSYYEAQRRLKEQHMRHMLMLQAMDNAASYIGPSRGYYYY